MGMQAKYGVLEMRSKEMMAQQSNAVSGASVALTNLGVRLESLVEQLIASYNISEQELEVRKSAMGWERQVAEGAGPSILFVI